MTMMLERVLSGTARVLVVDEMADQRRLARAALERRGFDVAEAEDGETALSLVWAGQVDLLVLAVDLPSMSGLAVLNRVRRDLSVPVILVSDRRDEADRILGLDLGADDYLEKPFPAAELGARAACVLRRSGPGPSRPADHLDWLDLDLPPAHQPPPVTVNQAERRVLVHGREVALTPREFDLLAFLVTAPRRVFSRAELLERVWASAAEWQDPATVTEHVRRLRRKIEVDHERPRWLQTVRGVGYRYDPMG